MTFQAEKFTKKPVTIEAVRLEANTSLSDIAVWLTQTGALFGVECENVTDGGQCEGGEETHHILIRTLEGVMRADYGDWIIKGVKGEFYPCKDDIFRATYDGNFDGAELRAV